MGQIPGCSDFLFIIVLCVGVLVAYIRLGTKFVHRSQRGYWITLELELQTVVGTGN